MGYEQVSSETKVTESDEAQELVETSNKLVVESYVDAYLQMVVRFGRRDGTEEYRHQLEVGNWRGRKMAEVIPALRQISSP